MSPGEKLVRAAVRRPLAFFAAFAALALLAGAAESGLAVWRAKAFEPSRGARWIWVQGAARAGNPLTVYAARDFELPEGVEKAWLSLAADESYVLWVNGQAVGSGSWQDGKGSAVGPEAGQAADLYEISDWLERGRNRLVVELRSASGAGGLLATLRLGRQDRPTLLSDDGWRIFRRADPRLLGLLAPLEDLGGEPPKLWQWPPTGRWRLEGLRSRPDLAPPDPLFGKARCPRALSFPGPGAVWTPLDDLPGCGLPRVSDHSLWDFGETVEGLLEMGLDPTEEPQPALLHFLDDKPTDLEKLRPAVILQPAPGASLWRDVAVRRFRYLALIGAMPKDFLRLQPVSPEQQAAYRPPAPPRGVFGLAPPTGPSALESAVWQRYQANPSAAEPGDPKP